MDRPPHIIEVRHVQVDGFRYRQPRMFMDGQQLSFDQMEAIGFDKIVEWSDLSAIWIDREGFELGPQAWDRVQAAKRRTIEMLGDRIGAASDVTRPFEMYLMREGWEPVMLDRLNAFNPGFNPVKLKDGRMVAMYSHFYRREDRRIYFQFGVDIYNFVFKLSDASNEFFQVPVDAALFDDAVNGRLKPIDFKKRP